MADAALPGPIWPLLLPIFGFTAYSLIFKGARADVHPLLFLCGAYGTALVVAALIWRATPQLGGTGLHLRDAGLAVLLGLTLVTIEYGVLMMFRVGWPVSTAITIVNVVSSSALVVLGLLLFKERLSAINVLGLALSLVGLVLVTRK